MIALLIGDRPEILAELARRFEAGGFATAFHDYENAASNCDISELPTLVVLDDFGGNTWDLCRRIRSRPDGHLALIWVVVDKVDPGSLQAATVAGADDCLPLPLESHSFDLRMAAAIRRFAAIEEIPRANAALRESVERWTLAERGAHAGVWDAKPSGLPLDSPEMPIWYSASMKQLFGFSEDEFPNVLGSWMSRVHPDELPAVMKAILQCLADKAEFEIEYRLLTKEGEYRWFSGRGQGIINEHGQLVRIAGSVRDITENRRVADALQASEAKWRSLVENAPDAITVVDLNGTIQFMNRDWRGIADAKSLGSNLISLVPEEQRESVRTVLQDVAQTGNARRFELTVRGADGKLTWYGSRVGPVHYADGIASLVIITTDISMRKRNEAALKHEQESLRKLLDLHERDRQIVAYEIHDGMAQSMAAALMHLQAFQHVAAEQLAGSDFDRGLNLLREAVQEARRLISGLRPPVLDELGIIAAIDYLINETRPDVPDIRFVHHTKFGRLAPPLESAIFRIVQEALSNIRTHSGSRRAKVELIEHGRQLRLVVRDWGKGFDPGKATEGRFGLQGIRQRVRLLGARVVIDSRPGEGTTVVVDFPLILNRSEDDSEKGLAASP